MGWGEEIRRRVVPVAHVVTLAPSRVVAVVVLAVVLVLVPALWMRLRLGVTLVHELGHAVVGLAVGRHFDGFVLRGDMSGHAVTRGRARGVGRVATTWAGYPAPAVLGALLVWSAGRGWAAPVVTGALAVLLLAATRVRSLLTALVVALALAGSAALWWWRDDATQEAVLLGLGVAVVLGGWRHLVALAGDHSATSDPAVLAALTHVPRLLWTATFVLVHGAAGWLVVTQLASAVRAG